MSSRAVTLPVAEDVEEPTDPQPFGPPLGPEETTKRRCVGCGAELEPDGAAYARGARAVLNAAFGAMLRAGVERAEAEAIVDRLAKDAGVDG